MLLSDGAGITRRGTSGDPAALCGHTWLCHTDQLPSVPPQCPEHRDVPRRGCPWLSVPGVAVQKCQAAPRCCLGLGQAQLGTGCRQDGTGQCHATAAGAGLALAPEQVVAGEVGLCPNNLHPSLGGAEPQGPARVPTPAPGKVTVPGVSSRPRELPQCAPAIPTRTCLSSCRGRAAPAVCQEGPASPAHVGAKLPTDPAFPHRQVPGCPPRAWNNPRGGLELRRGSGAPLEWHKPCVLRGVISPSWISLPWVTQLQLIPLSRTGLYLGHDMLRGSEGELAHAARLGTPRGCTAGRGQGTGRGDKGRDPDRRAPSRSACREPLGQQESQNSQTYISAQTLPSSPLALPSLQESSVPAPRLRGQPSSLRCHCQGPADPSLWWDTGTRPRSRQGQGWERNPGVLTRAVHLPPVTLWDTGTRRPRGRLGGHPPPGTPSSGTGDGTGHPTVPREGRGCPFSAPEPGDGGCGHLVPWSC